MTQEAQDHVGHIIRAFGYEPHAFSRSGDGTLWLARVASEIRKLRKNEFHQFLSPLLVDLLTAHRDCFPCYAKILAFACCLCERMNAPLAASYHKRLMRHVARPPKEVGETLMPGSASRDFISEAKEMISQESKLDFAEHLRRWSLAVVKARASRRETGDQYATRQARSTRPKGGAQLEEWCCDSFKSYVEKAEESGLYIQAKQTVMPDGKDWEFFLGFRPIAEHYMHDLASACRSFYTALERSGVRTRLILGTEALIGFCPWCGSALGGKVRRALRIARKRAD